MKKGGGMQITEQDIRNVSMLAETLGRSAIKRTRAAYAPGTTLGLMASSLEDAIEALAGTLDGPSRKGQNGTLMTAFFIGLGIGRLEIFDPDHARVFQKVFSALAGRQSVLVKWNRLKAVKESLTAQAASMWSTGSLLLHNEMADELLEQNPNAAKVVSRPVLLAALRPIAAKYDKVRGAKGIRKEKLPPK